MEDFTNLENQTENVIAKLRAAVIDAGIKLNNLSPENKQNENECSTQKFSSPMLKSKDDLLETLKPKVPYNERLEQVSLSTESIHTSHILTSTPRTDEIITRQYDSPPNNTGNNLSHVMELLSKEKNLSKELQEQVLRLEEELCAEKLNNEMNNLSTEQHSSGYHQITDTLEQIYKAQKQREDVMMQRIKQANHDRDEALLRAKALTENAQKSSVLPPDNPSNLKISNLLSMIGKAKSSEAIQKYSQQLLEKVTQFREKRLNQTAEEIKVLMEEKDGAINKCRKLEADVIKFKRQKNVHSHEQSAELEHDLQTTIEERDDSFEKLKTLEEEVETLRVYYNVNKSLAISQDQELMDKYNSYLANVRGEATKRIEESKKIAEENQKLHEALKQVTLERNSFVVQNQKMTTELNEAYTKCKSLERLVKVLRKKLITITQSEEINPQ